MSNQVLSSDPDRSILISQSNRSYQPGEVILHCLEPLVHVTKYEHRLFVCDHCLRKVRSSVVCPSCRKVYYCQQQCQQLAWNRIHRLECPILARHKPLQFENNGIDYLQRLTLRLYLLMSQQQQQPETSGPEVNDNIQNKPFTLHNGMEQRLIDMEYHPDQLKDTAQFTGILNYFKLYRIEPFDWDLLLRCYGILHVNAFGIDCYRDEPDDPDIGPENENYQLEIEHCGTGLYVEASVFDHSCVPNACASGDRLELEIRALRPIGPGERIYIDYLQDLMPKIERQQSLMERYFFRCQCEFGCSDSPDGVVFDSGIDYRRYSVLEKLIGQLSGSGNEEQQTREINYRQLYTLMKQRLSIQQQYYACAARHPCLSLYYHAMVRFLLLNQSQLDNIEQELVDLGSRAKDQLAVTHGISHRFYQTLDSVVLKFMPTELTGSTTTTINATQ